MTAPHDGARGDKRKSYPTLPWTCPRCESDDRSGQPDYGCTGCGYQPEPA